MPASQTLPAMVRAKYPGVYDDLTDQQLDTQVRAKFPGVYDDIPKVSAVPAANPLEQMGPRAPGGYTVSDAPEGFVSRTIRGMVHPSPGQQAAQDVLQFATGLVGAGRGGANPATVVEGGADLARNVAGATTRGAIRAGGAVADTVSPDVIGVVSPRMGQIARVVQRLRNAAATNAPSTNPAGPPRLVGRTPTLTDTLGSILEEMRTPDAALSAPSVPEAAHGGAQAATDTMRMLAERPKITPTGKAAQDLAAGNAPVMPRNMPSEARMGELVQKFGGTGPAEPFAPSPAAPRTLNDAMADWISVTRAAKVTPKAAETAAAVSNIAKGADPVEALAGTSSFASLPSDAQVSKIVAAKNARTTRAKGGTKAPTQVYYDADGNPLNP